MYSDDNTNKLIFRLNSHLFFKFGAITSFSNADKATSGFIVEPGEYNPETDLFSRGFKGSLLMFFHSLIFIPWTNKFGIKEGD